MERKFRNQVNMERWIDLDKFQRRNVPRHKKVPSPSPSIFSVSQLWRKRGDLERRGHWRMRYMRQGSWQTWKGAVLSRLVPIRRQMQRNNQPQKALRLLSNRTIETEILLLQNVWMKRQCLRKNYWLQSKKQALTIALDFLRACIHLRRL